MPDATVQPFYQLLWPLYRKGYLAVDLFFSISGFVFFYLYSVRIATGRVSLCQFAVNRFSRLYPLHLVTLLIVAALQWIYWQSHGVFFTYQANNTTHFVMHLFMASNWWPRSPFSFNGPVWSVSIEILLYASFFVVAKLGFAKPWPAALLAIVGALLLGKMYFLGRGVMSFYIGALCLFVVRDFNIRSIAALAVAIIGAIAIQWHFSSVILIDLIVIVVIFPAGIVALTFNERRLVQITKRARWLGNVSYSSYLLHFPLLFVVVIASDLVGRRPNTQSAPLMIAVIVVLILLSLASYRYFERPAQDWIRSQEPIDQKT